MTRFVSQLSLLALCAAATAQTTERVSVSSHGVQATCTWTYQSEITPDGRYVAFSSDSADLVPHDTNGVGDVFVHDRVSGTTERISVDSLGHEGNAISTSPSLSNNARYVVFISDANDLIANDTNGVADAFLHNRTLGTTVRVSLGMFGAQGNGACEEAQVSGDGHFVVFRSKASNLVAGDSNGWIDIFVRDLTALTTTRVSLSSAGAQGNGHSIAPSISDDGRYVAFSSEATNLIVGDTTAWQDIFVRDRLNGTTVLVSRSAAGVQANSASDAPRISGNGDYVVFRSDGNNLVAGDTNLATDVFRVSLVNQTVVRISKSSLGVEGNSDSYLATPSQDGQYVCFASSATNLVQNDVNGKNDIFVRDVFLALTYRVSVDSAGNPGNDDSLATNCSPSVSSNGRCIAFAARASNLIAGDTNGKVDVFVRDRYITGCPPVTTYCTAKQNSAGCIPSVSSAGLPSLSGSSTFFVSANHVLNQKLGHLFWGHSAAAIPFQGGTKCIAAPTLRTPNQSSAGSTSGTDCTGSYWFQFDDAYMQSQGLMAGDVIYGQFWSRDPGFAPPNSTGLTNAIRFTICP